MRIVIATATYYPQVNGVAVFSHNLACGLARRGNEVLVICPSQTGKNHTVMQDGVKVCYLKSMDVKIYPDQIHAVPAKKKLFYKHGFRASVFPRREVRRVLDEFRPDVVHVQVSDPIGLSVVAYARRHGIPVVATEHNQPSVITTQLKLGVVKKPADALLTRYFMSRLGKSDFVTMPTKKAIHDLVSARGKGFKVPVAAVSNGVDLSDFRPGRASAGVYKRYGLDVDRLTVLYVGRVDAEKNVEAVVNAYLKLCEKMSSKMQLVIVGDGTDRSRLIAKVAGRKDVHFLGRVMPPELYEVYQLGDVFVTASEVETQGIVLIEAAASGLPLVAVDAGAVSEVCVDKVNGHLCEPGNVEELTQALYEVLSDEALRKKYADESVRLAHEHDFERTLDKFMNIYERVGKQKRDGSE